MLSTVNSWYEKYTSKENVPEFIEINDTNNKMRDHIANNEKLKFYKHVDILCKEVARQINVMYRFKGILGVKESEAIYIIYIHFIKF